MRSGSKREKKHRRGPLRQRGRESQKGKEAPKREKNNQKAFPGKAYKRGRKNRPLYPERKKEDRSDFFDRQGAGRAPRVPEKKQRRKKRDPRQQHTWQKEKNLIIENRSLTCGPLTELSAETWVMN